MRDRAPPPRFDLKTPQPTHDGDSLIPDAPACSERAAPETEKVVKSETKATVRCLPLEGEGPEAEPGECVKTGAASARRVLFAKNY